MVYARLPRGPLIPTSVDDYNLDWTISFKEGSAKHVYFVVGTRGSMSSLNLRPIEVTRIKHACEFFDTIDKTLVSRNMKYDVVDSSSRLMEVVE